jgi:hypothetical protein
MTKPCLRCAARPVADEGPPHYPFCETCGSWVALHARYWVDDEGGFIGFMTKEEVEEIYRQSGEAALALAEQEGWT